jgi:hypothetical protein
VSCRNDKHKIHKIKAKDKTSRKPRRNNPLQPGRSSDIPGLFGAGIAFPERVVDPHGNEEYAVGVSCRNDKHKIHKIKAKDKTSRKPRRNNPLQELHEMFCLLL